MPETGFLVLSLLACVILYLTASGALAVEQRKLFHLSQGEASPPAQAGLDLVKVLAPESGKPLLVYFHGQGGSHETPAATLAAITASGSGLLAVEYCGYPGSTGSPSEDGPLRDVHAAWYETLSLAIPDKHLVAFGGSLGSGVALALAVTHKAGTAIVSTPYTSMVDLVAMQLCMFPVRPVMLDTFHSNRRIVKIAAPLLIVHCTAGRSIPHDFGRRLFALARKPKTFVPVPQRGPSDRRRHSARSKMDHAVDTFGVTRRSLEPPC
jgi:hypothetical protein